jgi:hypothetical protein
MKLYFLLSVFFLIGFLGVYVVNKKETDSVKKKNNWKKYVVYLLLVFGQLFLIDCKMYFYFAIILISIGAYELIKIGKSKRKTTIATALFSLFGLFFVLFFKETEQK